MLFLFSCDLMVLLLRDILANDNMHLDNMFVASLVADILRGMIYLHESPVAFHGDLKTSNCLVDSRWVLKISDFGLQVGQLKTSILLF
jgi:serine/threonine protein kinase